MRRLDVDATNISLGHLGVNFLHSRPLARRNISIKQMKTQFGREKSRRTTVGMTLTFFHSRMFCSLTHIDIFLLTKRSLTLVVSIGIGYGKFRLIGVLIFILQGHLIFHINLALLIIQYSNTKHTFFAF